MRTSVTALTAPFPRREAADGKRWNGFHVARDTDGNRPREQRSSSRGGGVCGECRDSW